MICIAALAGAGISTPGFAQHVTPASTPFEANGIASIDNGTPYTCNLKLIGDTNAASGSHPNHTDGGTFIGTNTGSFPCPLITVNDVSDKATFTVTGPGTADIYNLKVYVNNNLTCKHDGPVPFTFTNTNPGMDITLDPTLLYDMTQNPPTLTCEVAADLHTDDIEGAL